MRLFPVPPLECWVYCFYWSPACAFACILHNKHIYRDSPWNLGFLNLFWHSNLLHLSCIPQRSSIAYASCVLWKLMHRLLYFLNKYELETQVRVTFTFLDLQHSSSAIKLTPPPTGCLRFSTIILFLVLVSGLFYFSCDPCSALDYTASVKGLLKEPMTNLFQNTNSSTVDTKYFVICWRGNG